MKNGISRSIKMDQIQMRLVQVEVNGTAGTPVASGFGVASILQVIDNGVGDYTIILKRPFNADNSKLPKAMVQSLTANRIIRVSATDFDRVSVTITDEAGVAADADISLFILGSDARHSQA